MKHLPICLIAVSGLASVAPATVTEYTDRASFEAALGSFTLLEFEGLGDEVNLGTSVDFGDFNASNPGGVWTTAPGGFFGAPTGQIGDQNNGNSLYTLQPGYKALGMDIGLLFGAGNVNITVRDGLGNVVANGSRPAADNNFLGQNGTTFYGWISDSEDIQSVQIDQGGFPTIDNATFARGVPAPASAGLLGLAGLAAARRRR